MPPSPGIGPELRNFAYGAPSLELAVALICQGIQGEKKIEPNKCYRTKILAKKISRRNKDKHKNQCQVGYYRKKKMKIKRLRVL